MSAGKLQGRYDNDHPLLAILTDKAKPGEKVPVAVQVYGTVQGGGKFDEATMVLLSDDRVKPANIVVDASAKVSPCVPDGLSRPQSRRRHGRLRRCDRR